MPRTPSGPDPWPRRPSAVAVNRRRQSRQSHSAEEFRFSMPADQASPELTTRDVLSQMDRRIDLVETDLRKLDSKLDSRFDLLDSKIVALDSKMNTRFDAQDSKIEALAERMDARFRHQRADA